MTALKKKGITLDYFRMVEPGDMKRSIVDDITVMVVDLSGQSN